MAGSDARHRLHQAGAEADAVFTVHAFILAEPGNISTELLQRARVDEVDHITLTANLLDQRHRWLELVQYCRDGSDCHLGLVKGAVVTTPGHVTSIFGMDSLDHGLLRHNLVVHILIDIHLQIVLVQLVMNFIADGLRAERHVLDLHAVGVGALVEDLLLAQGFVDHGTLLVDLTVIDILAVVVKR